MKALCLLLSLLFLVPPWTACARTWYIRADGTGDAATIQAGINAASSGDTVLVAAGTYYENLEMRSWIVLRSESGPEQTTIDGMAAALVIRCFDVQLSEIRGFTLTNGRATHGGCILCTQGSNVIITENRIVDNVALDAGAGIYCYKSSPAITCNLIANNDVGGIYCSYGHPLISNNTIVANGRYSNVTFYHASPEVHHNIVVNGERGIVCQEGSDPTLWCNDVWNNSVLDYTCTPGANDISVDPLFCDPANLDFNLGVDSPCAGDPVCGLIGAYGIGCGPTSVAPTTWGAIKSMYR